MIIYGYGASRIGALRSLVATSCWVAKQVVFDGVIASVLVKQNLGANSVELIGNTYLRPDSSGYGYEVKKIVVILGFRCRFPQTVSIFHMRTRWGSLKLNQVLNCDIALILMCWTELTCNISILIFKLVQEMNSKISKGENILINGAPNLPFITEMSR